MHAMCGEVSLLNSSRHMCSHQGEVTHHVPPVIFRHRLHTNAVMSLPLVGADWDPDGVGCCCEGG